MRELCSFSDAKRVLAIFMTHPLAERENCDGGRAVHVLARE